VIGFVAGLVLLVLAVAMIPARFTRAIRRSLRDPEFRSLFGLVLLTLGCGPSSTGGRKGGACSTPSTSAPSR